MKKLNLLLVFVLILSSFACRLTPVTTEGEDLGCAAAVDGMLGLLNGLGIPDHFMDEVPVRTGTEFDPNQFFTVLTHLSMESGYTLDYVYHRDGLGAYPVLYARPVDQERYPTENDLAAAGETRTNYADYVRVDGTSEGYVQLLVFNIMSTQFYLDWHANYNDTLVVCNRAEAVTIATSLGDNDFGYSMPLADQLRVRFMTDVEPAVSIAEPTVEVQVTTFSNWGGFSRLTATMKSTFPHTIQDIQEEVIIPYDCGIMF